MAKCGSPDSHSDLVLPPPMTGKFGLPWEYLLQYFQNERFLIISFYSNISEMKYIEEGRDVSRVPFQI